MSKTMSQVQPFTVEEISYWEEIELQKKKEDIKQFIERGLPINARHEKYLQVRADMSKNIEAPAARELLAYTGTSEPSHLLDSSFRAERTHSGELKLERLVTSPDHLTDRFLKGPSAIKPASIDVSTKLGFGTYNQDTDSLDVRKGAANRYSDTENTYSTLNPPPQNLSISRIDEALCPSTTRNPKPQQIEGTNCMGSCDQQPRGRSFTASTSIDHGDKYTQRISMYSPRSGNWHGLVAKLDSQSKANWIVQSVVDRLRLKILKGKPKLFTAFNNEEVYSDATVKATWFKGGGSTHEHKFRVIEKAPFQVLLGTDLLDSDEIKWFNKKTVSNDVLVLAQKEEDKKEQEEIIRTEELADKESAMLAKKSQTLKREGKVPTVALKPKLKPKDPNKKVGEGKNDGKKSR